jgi:hypothetical protein
VCVCVCVCACVRACVHVGCEVPRRGGKIMRTSSSCAQNQSRFVEANLIRLSLLTLAILAYVAPDRSRSGDRVVQLGLQTPAQLITDPSARAKRATQLYQARDVSEHWID